MHDPHTLRIGLFGGSFNPPHYAHVLVVAWALATGEMDEVWVIPSGGHPFGKPHAPYDDRLEMCRRAFAGFGERVRISEIENEPRIHYSIETLKLLSCQHPGCHWRWIMGSDTLEDAPLWRSFDELMRLAPPLVIPRAGHASAAHNLEAEYALPGISSSLIRARLEAGALDRLDHLVPRPVLDWIESRGLYQRPGS